MSDANRTRSPREVTITDVASAAGTSIRTVSRVLNRSTKVNAETRRKVEAAISELKFTPSARARGLATGRSYLIGMVHNDRNALVLGTIQRGIVAEANERGYELVVHPASGEDGSIDEVVDFARRSRVDGLIVIPPISGLAGAGKALAEAGIPAVALSASAITGFDAMLISDERGAAAEVARHLVQLGHTKIALINGPLHVSSAQERRIGFLSGLTSANLEVLAEAEGSYDFPTGLAAADKMLSASVRPTAIFAANDIMAAAVLKSASGKGIPVPDQLSVVGFDGSLIADLLTPALTTVHRPFGELATIAARRLIDLIDNKPGFKRYDVSLSLIEGGSTSGIR